VIVKEFANNRLWKDYREVALSHGLRACWSSPIFARDGRILGTFAMYRDHPGGPDDAERELVDAATSLAGIAIERSQNEERLRLIESAVHHTHDAILIASAGAQPRAVYVNPAMATLTGYSLEELYRRRPGLLPEAGERRPLAEALEQGESIEYSGQVRRKDGTEYSAEWTVSPVRDANGAVSHWVWVERDVTARHRLEEQLRQSLKMDAIGRLAGGVAHDFNNLLAVIGGYSDLLLEEAESGSRQRAGLEEIRKAAERATSLTRQLLAFARRDVIAPRLLDLNAIVTDMETLLRRLIGEHIEMQAILDPNLPPIRVDSGQIEQVIMNLGVNARDAMPQGGKLTWETMTVELDESAAAPLGLKPSTYVVLAAGDTGVGIPDEVLPHIFEPFYTTKERGKGTGLGLATVYAIVVQNKGQIRVVSEPGCGARFEMYFPADKTRRPLADSEPGAPPAGAEETLTILLVEDDPQMRRLAGEVLRSGGHTVMEAERGDAALQFAAHYPGEIDLLLADVMMPGLNGREVADRLVRMRPGTRVLFMSGYLDESVPKVGISTDRDGFLQKPFTPEQLLNKVLERMRE
jgi:PAS domain S-box-containing protein